MNKISLFFQKYFYTIKYWLQGDSWSEAKLWAAIILTSFDKERKIWKKW